MKLSGRAVASLRDLHERGSDVEPDGTLRGRRPIYSGKAIARVSVGPGRPIVATLRSNVFPADPAESPAQTEVVQLETTTGEAELRVRTVRPCSKYRGAMKRRVRVRSLRVRVRRFPGHTAQKGRQDVTVQETAKLTARFVMHNTVCVMTQR